MAEKQTAAPEAAEKAGRQGDGGRRRGLPIVVALMGSFGLLVAVAVALVFLAGYQVARLNTIELIRDKSGLVIHSMEQRIRAHLDPVQRQLDYLAGMLGARQALIEEREELGRLLLASLAATPQVSVVAFVDPEMRVLRAFRNRPDERLVESDWADDPSVRNMVQAVEANAVPQWGGLFVAEDVGLTYINLLMPVREGPQVLGTLIAGISIFDLSEFLTGLEHLTGETPFILYDRDQVLAHRLLLERAPEASDAHPLPSLAELGDPVLQALHAPDEPSAIEASFRDGVEAHVAEVGGERYVFLFRELQGYGAQAWTVGTYLPTGDLAPQFARLRYVLVVGAAVLVAALLLAYLLGRGVSRPVRHLAAVSKRIRDFDFAEAPSLRRGPFREINEAAEAYGGMIEALRFFERYLPRSLVRRLMRHAESGDIASDEREVSVLFTDIVGFTALAERLSAPELPHHLNEHFTLVDWCIEAEGGTLDKYIGDAAMAFWGAPEEQPDHAARACRAALAISQALREDNRRRMGQGLEPLRLRIGVHSGPVVVGNIGAPSRINYTVIGDTVNTAQRLELLAREMAPANADVAVLVSDETAEQAGPGFDFERMGNCRLLGRHEPVATFALRDTAAA